MNHAELTWVDGEGGSAAEVESGQVKIFSILYPVESRTWRYAWRYVNKDGRPFSFSTKTWDSLEQAKVSAEQAVYRYTNMGNGWLRGE